MTSRHVLRWALAQDFRPGQNLPGGGVDAGWVYALPSLELETVAHLGDLSRRTELTLQRLGSRIVPLSRAERANRSDAKNGPYDLIIVGRRAHATTRDIAALARLLAPEGVMYVDGPATTGLVAHGLDSVEWWVTPLAGEPVTVLPMHHDRAAEHFMRRGLGAPLITRESIGRARRRLAASRARGHGAPIRTDGQDNDRSVDDKGPGAEAIGRVIAHRVVYGGASVVGELERGILDRLPRLRRRSRLVAASHAGSDAPPAYIRNATGRADELLDWQWSMTARAEYRTQKVVFFLLPPGADEPALVAKLARSGDVSPRLRNAHAGLLAVDRVRGRLGMRIPAPTSLGEHRGLAILTEEAVAGASLDRLGVTEPLIELGVDLIVDLGMATAESVEPAVVAAALHALSERCESSGIIDAAGGETLRGILADLSAIEDPLACVLQHGDPGCWNMIVRPSGDLVLLDWENAEAPGMPLWDLLDFLRSCAVVRAGPTGGAQVAEASVAPFIGEGAFAGAVAGAVRRYRETLPMDDRYFTALFYSVWAYQALKELTRQRADAIGSGVYGRMLRTLLARHRDGGLPPTVRRYG